MSSIDPSSHLLSADGGVEPHPDGSADPFQTLDDLMHVVEALCPTYPTRETFARSALFKL